MTSSVVSTGCNKPFSRTIDCLNSASYRRFFGFAAGLAIAFLPVSVVPGPLCQIKKPDAYVHIKYVIDGDTVVLANGEKLRLIGIDTPEIGYRGNRSQPGAVSARDFLRGLISERESYPVIYGVERQDHYGRTLGHLFLADNRNLQALLLAQGYATLLNIPPNFVFIDCYQEQVNKAIQARLGIWKLVQYQTVAANSLSGKERGFRIIHGRISDTANSRSSIWLNMNRRLAIRITREDLKYFSGPDPENLTGRNVQVRGRLYRRNKQLRLRLRHPADLEILTTLTQTKQASKGNCKQNCKAE